MTDGAEDSGSNSGSQSGGEWQATYRVQLHSGFSFDDAAAVIDYLAALGISHLYCSPYLQAAPGSTHGYDVVDHSRLNADLGGEPAQQRMVRALHSVGMGQLLDIVPNHMAIGGRANRWWWDVLENGPASLYAPYFDIDWEHQEAKLAGKVLVPVLGDHYGRVLEAGELVVARTGASFVVRHHDHELPISPRTLDEVLGQAAREMALATAPGRGERGEVVEGVSPDEELASIATALGRLPASLIHDRGWPELLTLDMVVERNRDKEVLAARLDQLFVEHPAVADAVDDVLARLNADVDALDVLLDRQNHRLAYWKVAGRELGYRRFFDITDLVALRVENPEVFDETHALVLELVRRGDVNGLRVDHPDGLRDPEGYLRRLADATGEANGASAGGSDGGAYIVVEKILGAREELPTSWPVAGTTGYEFLNRVGGVFVDPGGEAALTACYEDFTGEVSEPEEIAHEAKHLVMRDVLASDVERLTAVMVDVCEATRHFRDFTRWELRETISETMAAFDVYRTYVRPGVGVRAEDVARVLSATERASLRRPDLDARLFDLVADILLLRRDGDPEREVAARFQQVCAAVMAKGVEDTAMYRFHRLVSLNEVGAELGGFGLGIETFHEYCVEAVEHRPRSLLATATHDTKRGEDVRARLNLLSEIPDQWVAAVRRWSASAEPHRSADLPDRTTEYLFWQTLVGAWPIETARLWQYMEKAVRESKSMTSWTDPQPAYEGALQSFVEGVAGDPGLMADVASFVGRLLRPGQVVSLAQTVVKLTAPGVPDMYQGTELWDLSLVDPDNRRPVDYAERRRVLAVVQSATGAVLWPEPPETPGAAKMLVVHRALKTRRRMSPSLDGNASYEPLATEGSRAGNCLGYLRGGRVAVVVPRLVLGLELAGGWDDTVVGLPDGVWMEELSGTQIEAGTQGPGVKVAALLENFPVALLTRQ